MSTKQYDPGMVVVSFGALQISGFADGTFITADRSEDAYSLTVGADGEVARTRMRNKSGEVTLTLMASSAFNDLLAAIAAADELDPTGVSGVRPLFVKDLLGTTLVSAPGAWIKKVPSVEFAKELGSREWVFACGNLEIFSGGSLAAGL